MCCFCIHIRHLFQDWGFEELALPILVYGGVENNLLVNIHHRFPGRPARTLYKSLISKMAKFSLEFLDKFRVSQVVLV